MTYKLLIDGRLVDGALTLDVVNPATAKVFATCARADEPQLDQAVAAAKRASTSWGVLSYGDRGVYLRKLADALDSRKEEFTELLTREQGKPLLDAESEVSGSAATLRYYSEQELPLTVLQETDHGRILEQRTPLGVVAVITPWNFPLILMVSKVAQSLCTGNTVIAKPAPSTPLTTALFGDLAADILPRGVFNVIIDANDLGARITSHPDIGKISFTGSTNTGRRVMESAAATLKRLTLELGGNDAAILLDDASVKEVAPKVFAAAMINAGQICIAAKRVYAPRAMYDELCEELARLSKELVVDDGLKPGTQMGPAQNRQQYERVLELIEDARQRGTIIAGGFALDREGFFIAPTVVRDLPEDARLVREEQFGPVIPVLAYDSIDEVIDLANDTPFGLAGTIWTSNPDRGVEVAKRIQSGTVWVNKHLDMPPNIPFGGAKQSGIGQDRGIEGLKEYTQAKIINVAR